MHISVLAASHVLPSGASGIALHDSSEPQVQHMPIARNVCCLPCSADVSIRPAAVQKSRRTSLPSLRALLPLVCMFGTFPGGHTLWRTLDGGFDSTLGYPGEGPSAPRQPPMFVAQAMWEGVHSLLLQGGPGEDPDSEQLGRWAALMQGGRLHRKFTPSKAMNTRRLQGAKQLPICTLNSTVNSSAEAIAGSLVRKYRIIFLQEHHLVGTALQRALYSYAKMGVKAHLAPAVATRKGGTQGGTGFLWGPGTQMIGLPHNLEDGRACGAIFALPGAPRTFCVSLYGDTYSQHHTVSLVTRTLQHCLEVGMPYIIGGDFNMSPSQLQQALADSPALSTSIQIYAPITTTCRMPSGESIIDYWIVGGGAEMFVHKAFTDESIAVTPHVASALTL
jgi:hypothetical protein